MNHAGVALALALCAPALGDEPVRLIGATESTFEIELLTAPSNEGGAVVFQRVRFEARGDGTGWRLVEPAQPGAGADAATTLVPASIDAATPLDQLGITVAKVTGDSAVLVPLHEGDAAICILEGGALKQVFLADAYYFELRKSVAADPSGRAGLACLRQSATGAPDGAIRSAVLGAMDQRLRRIAGNRLAALSFLAGSDVTRSNLDAARAALRYGQPELDPPDDGEARVYNWLFERLSPEGPAAPSEV